MCFFRHKENVILLCIDTKQNHISIVHTNAKKNVPSTMLKEASENKEEWEGGGGSKDKRK